MAVPAEAKESTRYLINVPGTEVLPNCTAAVSVGGRVFLPEADEVDAESESGGDNKAGETLVGGPNIQAGFGMWDKVEMGVTAVSAMRSLDHVAGYIRLALVEEGFLMPAIGVGVFDITTDPRPNEDVGLPVTGSDEYAKPGKTNNSAYFVAAKRIPFLGRAYVGMGRGRFIGRCGQDAKLHGMFVGGEISFMMFRLVGELDGRTVNAGIGMASPQIPLGPMGIGINALAGGKYLPNARMGSHDSGLRPAVFGRFELVISPTSCAVRGGAVLPAPPAPTAAAAGALSKPGESKGKPAAAAPLAKPAAAKPAVAAPLAKPAAAKPAAAAPLAKPAVAKPAPAAPVAKPGAGGK